MATAIDQVIKAIEKTFSSQLFYQRLGNKTKSIVFKRTKAGFGVSSDTSKSPVRVKLKKLSPKYKEYRKKVNLGEFGRLGKSNLTLTGQMLASMRSRSTSSGFKITIPRTLRRTPILGRVSVFNNNDILQETRKERPFFALTVAEQRVVLLEIRDELNKALRTTVKEEI